MSGFHPPKSWWACGSVLPTLCASVIWGAHESVLCACAGMGSQGTVFKASPSRCTNIGMQQFLQAKNKDAVIHKDLNFKSEETHSAKFHMG